MPPIPTNFRGKLLLRGVVDATYPKLIGTVLGEYEAEVTLPVPDNPTLKMRTRVLRANATGMLDFDYRLYSISSDYDHELSMSLAFAVAGLEITFVDFRIDGPGTLPPGLFESTAMEPAAFRFTYGLAVGRDTRRCMISTNAREFTETGGKLKLICHNKRAVILDVPMPLGVMAKIPPPTPAIEAESAAEAAVTDSSVTTDSTDATAS